MRGLLSLVVVLVLTVCAGTGPALAGKGSTVRCLLGPDGELPSSEEGGDLVAVVARGY